MEEIIPQTVADSANNHILHLIGSYALLNNLRLKGFIKMDNIINSLAEMLKIENKEIADLLVLSKHNIDDSGQYSPKGAHTTLAKFEIISPPKFAVKLNNLSSEKKNIIKNLVYALFPVKNGGIDITDILYLADPNLSADTEFIQYIEDEQLILDVSLAMNLLERKPPKFWNDYKSNTLSKPLEDDIRSEFFRMLGMKYIVGSEEESKVGRTDLTLKSSSINRKIFEFKVWGRNDFKTTSKQLLKYMSEIDDSGFLIMANDRLTKNITLSEYKSVVECDGYISQSLETKKTIHGLEYYTAEYNFNGNQKKINHFILNLK